MKTENCPLSPIQNIWFMKTKWTFCMKVQQLITCKIKESSLDFTVLSSQNLYICILSFPLDESSRPIYLFLKKKKEKEIQPIKSSLVMGKLTHIHVFMFVLIFSGFKSKTALLVSRLIKIIITTMCFTYKMYMH